VQSITSSFSADPGQLIPGVWLQFPQSAPAVFQNTLTPSGDKFTDDGGIFTSRYLLQSLDTGPGAAA
jgi:hypothetical protein